MKSKEEYWDWLFKGYERSRLSQEEFCSEQGIPIAKFKYQWRKRIVSENQKADSQNKSDKPIHLGQGELQFDEAESVETIELPQEENT